MAAGDAGGHAARARARAGGRAAAGVGARPTRTRAAAVVGALVVLAACSPAPSPGGAPALRDAAGDRPLIGTAVASAGRGDGSPALPLADDERYRDLLATEFSSLTPENQLKWPAVHPAPGRYDFAPAEAVVAFAEEHGQQVRGHTLL